MVFMILLCLSGKCQCKFYKVTFMSNRTLGIIIVLFGGLVLYSNHESAWIVSAISIGIGTGIFFWKDKENNINS